MYMYMHTHSGIKDWNDLPKSSVTETTVEWIQNITAKSKFKLKQKLATNLDNTPPV